jgi:hypothetical protein
MSDSEADEKKTNKEPKQYKNDNTYSNTTTNFFPSNLKQIKAEEARRNLKWVSFTRQKVSFGFQHLSTAYVPAMLEEPHGLW